jgi:RNA-directed DNA polymerase
VGNKRQKNQLELAFGGASGGEASRHPARGTESPAAKHETEGRTQDERLMEEVCEPRNLKRALQRVKANRGSPGIDGMTVEMLGSHLVERWSEIRASLLNGTYKPQPVKRVEIPKPDGGVRKLGIPTVVDRFVQQAVMQVLQRQWDPTFSEHSYGFRPGRSAHQAVAQAQRYIAQGNEIVVDLDLEKFFDRVNHDILMGLVSGRVRDKRVLRLIRAFLNAGVMENGLVGPTDEGTPQGGPLSPLLSNLVLDQLDRELERRGHRFVRYADDCNVYVRSERAGKRVMESIEAFISGKLKLKVNSEKSAVARPSERKFLGFTFARWNLRLRQIAPKAIARFKERIRAMTNRHRGGSLGTIVEELARYLNGWRGYFGFTEVPEDLKQLEAWVRRRLRCLLWTRWKTRKRRAEELRRHGLAEAQVRGVTSSGKGPWLLSRTREVQAALSNAYLDSLGLPRLTPARAP